MGRRYSAAPVCRGSARQEFGQGGRAKPCRETGEAARRAAAQVIIDDIAGECRNRRNFASENETDRVLILKVVGDGFHTSSPNCIAAQAPTSRIDGAMHRSRRGGAMKDDRAQRERRPDSVGAGGGGLGQPVAARTTDPIMTSWPNAAPEGQEDREIMPLCEPVPRPVAGSADGDRRPLIPWSRHAAMAANGILCALVRHVEGGSDRSGQERS